MNQVLVVLTNTQESLLTGCAMYENKANLITLGIVSPYCKSVSDLSRMVTLLERYCGKDHLGVGGYINSGGIYDILAEDWLSENYAHLSILCPSFTNRYFHYIHEYCANFTVALIFSLRHSIQYVTFPYRFIENSLFLTQEWYDRFEKVARKFNIHICFPAEGFKTDDFIEKELVIRGFNPNEFISLKDLQRSYTAVNRPDSKDVDSYFNTVLEPSITEIIQRSQTICKNTNHVYVNMDCKGFI